MSAITGIATDVRRLASRADRLRARCEQLAGAASGDQTRATLARAAGRLGSSVVRPLGEAVGGEQTEADIEVQNDAQLEQALHELAVDATKLRIRAPGGLALQEAAAALQDLACQAVADDAERLEARRTEFVTLLEGLPTTIQSAPNGPYLLTNVSTVTDWLGVSLEPTPQAALCRCGASAIKPWCDGSHAQIGFQDAKSEDRVPDRLDRYQGLGVAIADNRVPARIPGSAPTVHRPCSGPTQSRSLRRQAAASTRFCAPPATAPPER